MKLSKNVVSLALAAVVMLAGYALPRVSAAQPYDHLKCFKVKDPGAFKSATMDLDDLIFGLTTGCEIKKKAKEFCIPVQKNVTSIEGGSDTPLAAQDQTFDRLCYKLKCPVSPTGTANFTDQFGTRGFEKFKIAEVCTPAVKGDPPQTITWPADPDSYVTGPVSYLDSLTIPAVVGGIPTCCKDFGEISRDFISGGTNNIDNALATLSSSLLGFGFDLQQVLDDSLGDGSLIVLLDHQDLDGGSLPDDFALAQLGGIFDGGTTPLDGAAGNGQFLVKRDSFKPGTGEPQNFAFPSAMDGISMAAGPFQFGLILPLGVALEVPVSETELAADHGAITAAGVPYSNGVLSGYVEVSAIFGALNLILNSSQCTCLGISSDVYTQLPNGSWTATCVSNAESLCTLPEESLCVTLAGTNLFGATPQVCSVVAGIVDGQADLDLDNDPLNYEGLSLGLGFTAQNAQINGIEP